MIASVFALVILGIGVVSLAIACWYDDWRKDKQYRHELELIDRKARASVERMR